MDENNQILDVTYGNFSCRLEGFEDSVETMKTVVSYFHELAGHARFMDVEPQAPDMATLALLTQQQTGEPVEVEGEGNHVSLRVDKEVVEEDLEDAGAALLDDGDADVTDESELEAVEHAEEQLETEADIDADESVADKLERIRAVADGDDTPESDEFAEDLSEEASDKPSTNPLSQRLADLAARSEENTVEGSEVEVDVPTDEPISASQDEDLDQLRNVFDDAPIMDEMAAEDEAADDEAADNDEITENLVMDAELSEDTAEAEVAEIDEVEAFVEEPDAETAEDDEDLAAALEAIDDEETVSELDEAAETVEDVPSTDFQMVDENDLAAADVPEVATSDADEDDTAEDEAVAAETDRSPLLLTEKDVVSRVDTPMDTNGGDDFNLQEEVAKVEAEIAARRGNEVARHGLPRSVEDAMSRIMSQTDQHLNQPESRRHRDAFAQLKAAVAATEAARQLGDQGETRNPDADFKDDLGAHAAEEAEEKEAQPAPPLKLVKSEMVQPENTLEKPVISEPAAADQPTPTTKTRIIEPAEEPQAEAPKAPKPMDAASERLRQIAALKEAEGVVESTGFAEFAAAHGAVELVDKLEAAGAYICFVEGSADFSRPQVMKLVQTATDEEITREDGLRCFGRLLRQARLVKLSNGRFQVSDNTQYRPDGEQAAQG